MVLGLLVSAIIYRIKTKAIWTESLLAGLGIFLIVLGANVLLRFTNFNILSGQIGDFLLTPLLYGGASALLMLHPRFKTDKPLIVALWIAGAILVLKIVSVTLNIFTTMGLSI